MVEQDCDGAVAGVEGVHRAIGFDVEHELVIVCLFTDAGRLDLVRDVEHWAVERVDRDRPKLKLFLAAFFRGAVAAARSNGDLHLEGGGFVGQCRKDLVRIHDFDVGILFEVRCRDRPLPLDRETQLDRLFAVELEAERLEVQDHLERVFLDVLERGEFMVHPFDLHCGDCCPWEGREQYAAHGVAKRGAVALCARFNRENTFVWPFTFRESDLGRKKDGFHTVKKVRRVSANKIR